MPLRDQLLVNPGLSFENNIFFQKGIIRPGSFEKNYINLREKEGRVYSDDIVKRLPEIPAAHSLKHEWLIRKISLEKLIHHLKHKDHCNSILEVGCGNGWLSHQLATSLNSDTCALDVNETELRQGARIFSSCEKLSFLYADIFTVDLSSQVFDSIILASSVQYFTDLKSLIFRLFKLLRNGGEIHILDSPLYPSADAAQEAQKRSEVYFEALGFTELKNTYFHHTIHEIHDFSFKLLFNPNSFVSRINRKVLKIPQPVFPWIVIKHP